MPITAYAASAASRIWSANSLCSPLSCSQVDGDARGLHTGQHPLHRQLHLAQQRRRVDPRQLLVERIGEVGNGAGAQDQRLHRLIVDALGVVEQRKLLLFGRFRTQFTS